MEISEPQQLSGQAGDVPPHKTSRFGNEVAMTVATNLFLNVLGLLTGIITARMLGPAGRGELAVVQLWGMFIGSLSLLGLSDAVIYFCSRERDQASQYWSAAASAALVCGLPVVLLGIWGASLLIPGQGEVVASSLPLFAFGHFLLSALSIVPLNALRGVGHFSTWNLLRMLPQVGWVMTVCVAGLGGEMNVPFLVNGYLLSYALFAAVILWNVVRRIPPRVSLGITLWPQLLKFGLPSLSSSIPSNLLQDGRLSQLFIAMMLEPRALGFLAVGTAFGNLMRVLPGAISFVLFPRTAATQGNQQVRQLLQGTRLTVLVTILCTIGVASLCPIVVPLLFGHEFSSVVGLVVLMVVAGGGEGVKIVLGSGLRGLGRPSAVFWGELIALGLAFFCLLVSVRPWGVYGAALALVVGNSVAALFLAWSIQKITDSSIFQVLCPTSEDVRSLLSFTRKGVVSVKALAFRPL
jgi:O-antigen/teichoic acid export membrane protein